VADLRRHVALAPQAPEQSRSAGAGRRDRVLVTRHGKPAALIIGVAGETIEDLLTRSDPEFWALLESRRKAAKLVSADEMRKRLGAPRKSRAKR